MPVSQPDQVSDALRALWQKFRDTIMGRVAAIERACSALSQGALDEQLRRHAEQEAHKLAGTLGSFGLDEGSQTAREIEHLLQPGNSLGPEEARKLSQLYVSLRQQTDRGPQPQKPATPTRGA